MLSVVTSHQGDNGQIAFVCVYLCVCGGGGEVGGGLWWHELEEIGLGGNSGSNNC